MNLFGYDDIQKTLTQLADTRALSHAYVFFGEPQVGKFLCAQSLANYLEHGVFEKPTKPLQETYIIDLAQLSESEDSQESIGISAVRQITHFVQQMPVLSPYRTVIIRDAEWLTDQAQNALLKTLEEPPAHSLIILIVSYPDTFLPAVASRLQKLYFKTLSDTEIQTYIQNIDFSNQYGIIDPHTLIQNTFGRIGRLWNFVQPTKQRVAALRFVEAICTVPATEAARDALVDDLLAFDQKHPQHLFLFFEELLVHLRARKQYKAAQAVILCSTKFQTLSLSKRVHLKELLCLIQ